MKTKTTQKLLDAVVSEMVALLCCNSRENSVWLCLETGLYGSQGEWHHERRPLSSEEEMPVPPSPSLVLVAVSSQNPNLGLPVHRTLRNKFLV